MPGRDHEEGVPPDTDGAILFRVRLLEAAGVLPWRIAADTRTDKQPPSKGSDGRDAVVP